MLKNETDLKIADQTAPARERYVRKVTWIGLLTNIGLSGLKFAAGYFGRSQALIADAIHSLTDTTTDIAVIAGSHYWSRPPDECHPYGHRRLESTLRYLTPDLVRPGVAVDLLDVLEVEP